MCIRDSSNTDASNSQSINDLYRKKNERRIVMIDWKNNLEILMPKLTEGALTKDEEKQLEKILGSNPEARKYYLSYIDVDTALEEQIGIPNFNIPNILIQILQTR